MPMLKIARVTYDHHELTLTDGGPSVGELIDAKINETLNEPSQPYAAEIQEVSVTFEPGEFTRVRFASQTRATNPVKRRA